MNIKRCIVFADAFSYATYSRLGGLKNMGEAKKLIPGVGYSSNLHFEIFQGKQPDQMGFFTDYSLVSKQKYKTSKILRVLDNIETFNNIYRTLEKKLTPRRDNIPFSERKSFSKYGRYLFEGNDGKIVPIFGADTRIVYKETTAETFFEGERLIEEGINNLILVNTDMDHFGHILGNNCDEYDNLGKNILNLTEHLFSTFRARNNDAECIFISDHGMANVHAGIDVLNSIYARFGIPGEKYFIYVDSCYLRLWKKDEATFTDIVNFLSNNDLLCLISTEKRRKYGIVNPDFGDMIWSIRKGYMFAPNNFDVVLKKLPYGMHGYLESDDDASGVFLSDKYLANNKELQVKEIFDLLHV